VTGASAVVTNLSLPASGDWVEQPIAKKIATTSGRLNRRFRLAESNGVIMIGFRMTGSCGLKNARA
jgi:hypothetical protein